MDLSIIILLIATGIFVGIVNTFASGGAVVTIAVFTALGLPLNIANGTNRVPVLFQCLTMSLTFGKQGVLDYRVGLKLSIPTVIGAVIGAQFATVIDNSILSTLLGAVLIILLLMMLFNSRKIMSTSLLAPRELKWQDYLWFLLIGLYGGCVHIGVGYFILAATIMGMGYNILEANALKGFIVLMYIPFSLSIFIINGQVAIMYGLMHGIGNIIGAYMSARYAKHIGMQFIRWFMVCFITITILDLFKIIDLQKTFIQIFN